MNLTYNILIVDDVSSNIKVAMSILKECNYNFSFAMNGKEALDIIKTKEFDLILLDIMMPEMDGFSVINILKQNPTTSEIPVIFLSAKADVDSIEKGFKLGAVDYLTKPFQPTELISRVSTHLELYQAKKVLVQNNLDLNIKIKYTTQRLMSELELEQQELISILTELMESTSDETGKHIRRVAEYSKLLTALHESLTEEDELIVFVAAPMHDIGKMTIPPAILNKPAKLTDSEFTIMKTHTTNAHKILSKSNRKFVKAADIIALQHHEKWNGKGYPKGLSGQDIHIYGRIVALADVLDALTHKRVYKDSWTFEDATTYIIEHKNTQFDPYLVELFENNLDLFKDIMRKYS